VTRGLAVTLAATLCILALETTGSGPAQHLLASPPTVYLGRISYAVYLWHWPIIVVANRITHAGPGGLMLLSAGLATILASLSFELLEHPIRQSRLLDVHPRAVIAAGLALTIPAGLAIVPTLEPPTALTTATEATTFATPKRNNVNWQEAFYDRARAPSCEGEPVEKCVVVHGTGKHMMLMGDSHAEMLLPAFERIARENDLTLSLAINDGCPWQRGLFRAWRGTHAPIEEACRRRKVDWYDRMIPELDPGTIFLMNAIGGRRKIGVDDADGHPAREGDYWSLLERSTEDAIRILRKPGRTLVIIEPIPAPLTDLDPLQCLSSGHAVEECRYVTMPDPTPLERFYRQLAAKYDDVVSLDVDRLVCPYLPICDPVVNGVVVRWDPGHLTQTFARALGPAIGVTLRKQGVLTR
jgi:hypothetical protein